MSAIDRGTPAHVVGAAVVGEPRRRGIARKVATWVTGFAYILILYVIIELTVSNVRNILFDFGGYSLTWVEVMYLLATFVAMGELLRVSKPGIDNTREALAMLAVGIIYLVLFVLGAAGVGGFSIFSNTEFLMLMFISAANPPFEVFVDLTGGIMF